MCKLWHRLLYEQPQLWQALSIQPPGEAASPADLERWRSGKLALVRRVAPLVREAQLHGGCFQAPPRPGSYLLADFLDCLDSTALRGLSIKQHAMPGQAEAAEDAMAAGVAACLQALAVRFPGLQALELRGPVSLPAAGAWALRQLRALRRLEIEAYEISEQLVQACAAGLQQLSGLELTGFQSLPSLRQLTVISQLEKLSVADPQSGDSGLELPPASAFPKLVLYRAHASCFAVRAGATLALLSICHWLFNFTAA